MSLLPKLTSPSKQAPLRTMLALVAALAVLSLAASAVASTVLKLDLESLVANSEQIVDAKVVDVSSKVEGGKVYTYTKLEVREGLKGASDGQTVVVKQLGGRTKELATWVPGVPHFQAGERVIAFLEKPAPDAFSVVTGMSQGKFQIALGPDNVTPFVVPYLGDLALIEPSASEADSQASQRSALGEDTAQPQFQRAAPAELYKRVLPLDIFKQNVRDVIRGQEGE